MNYCAVCGAEMGVHVGRGRSSKFCSPECRAVNARLWQRKYHARKRRIEGGGRRANLRKCKRDFVPDIGALREKYAHGVPGDVWSEFADKLASAFMEGWNDG